MSRLLFIVLLGLLMTTPSFGNNEELQSSNPTSGNQSNKENKSTVDTAAEKLKKEHDKFVREAQDQLGDLNRRIAELRRMARKESGEAKIRINQEIRLLEKEQKEAEQKLAKLQAELGKKWDVLKADVSDAIERLKKSIEKTKNDIFSKEKNDSH